MKPLLEFLPPHHKAFAERFVAACERDARVVAAFLGGSYATGQADASSDIDVCAIVATDSLDGFIAGKAAFVHQLGNPVFLEDFGRRENVLYIFPDDVEGELYIADVNELHALEAGAFIPLLDKAGALDGATFPLRQPAPEDQVEKLRRQITWFWHDLSHFITAMRRGQVWWARGQLEVLRGICVNLTRLSHNFFDRDAGEDAYWKIDNALPVELLSPLQATLCPLEPQAMLDAARIIIGQYRALAYPLAQNSGMPYPSELERVIMARFNTLHH